ncbi:5-oxoprolinase subunit PxpA [Maribacter sp. ACAM166]|uniref:5-oxoprolinase subunit PxpA n=1 Tax=Maribacter sp. ACAM166 TaxID=2508996 RepID=UPI0010FDA433|nr:5-oxoprolinase subunit PxpA [Maribacter sp. ACAM166]TLP72785.1 5-oxoprolinase subunit PxpA [Maribacter sp. ACAM166]
MTKRTMDINCDVGEGIGNEAELFSMISSCNIACGVHAGSKETIRLCLKLAQKYSVSIGAHPSYPDKENFGRISLDINDEDLIKSIDDQMQLFTTECIKLGVSLHHIKPHGALYNDVAKDEHKAQVFLKAIAPYKEKVFLYVPCGSVIQEMALATNFKIKREAFADRNYNNDLSLVSRNQENALISNGQAVLEHLLLMYNENVVETLSGEKIPIYADTYCIHGDTPDASQILTYITKHLPKYKLQSKP